MVAVALVMSTRDHRRLERRSASAARSSRADSPEIDVARLSATAIEELHRRVGNAVVSGMLARQTLPAERRSKRSPLANRTALIGAGIWQPIVKTTTEISPAGGWPDSAKPGYTSEAEAVVDAQRHAAEHTVVTVVVAGAAGRLHVYETDAQLVSSIAIRMDFVKHVAQPPPDHNLPWWMRKNVALANAREGRFDAVRQLVVEATGIEDVNVAVGRAPHVDAPARAKPGDRVVNVDPSFGLSGRTYNGPDRAEPVGDLPQPVAVIGTSAFGSPELLRSTVAHELRHAHHDLQVVRLIEQWREAGAKPGFHSWLEKHKAKVPSEIYWVAQGLAGGSGGADTELFASLESAIDLLYQAEPAALGDPDSKESIQLLMHLQAMAEAYVTAGDAPAAAGSARLAQAVTAARPVRRTALCAILAKHPRAITLRMDERFKAKANVLVARLEAAAGC
jgi:hypothetical protein